MLETDVSYGTMYHDREEEGLCSGYRVTINGTPIGPNSRKEEAWDHMHWLAHGGFKDILGIYGDLLEKAFDEQEKRNGNK